MPQIGYPGEVEWLHDISIRVLLQSTIITDMIVAVHPKQGLDLLQSNIQRRPRFYRPAPSSGQHYAWPRQPSR
jgi:hypothetical protein